MATIDDIKNGSNPEDDGTIVDPNLRRRRSLAENAARHGIKETKSGKDQKPIDLVKDMGYKSDEEVAEERMGQDDISQALGDDLMAAAERKKREIDEFSDALEHNDGDIKEAKEEMATMSGQPNFEEMLRNPPDPLNKDLKDFNKEQRKRMMETKSPEELEAMGLMPEEPAKKPTPFEHHEESENEVIHDEDDDILSDMEDNEEDLFDEDNEEGEFTRMDEEVHIGSGVPLLSDEELEAHTIATDKIPEPTLKEDTVRDEEKKEVKQENIAASVVKGEDETFGIDAADKLSERAAAASITELEGVNIDEELLELEREELSEDDEESQKVYRKKLESAREDIKNKVIPIALRVDIKGFTLLNKPVTISNSVEMAHHSQHIKTARWALFSSKLPIEMSGFLGTEIDDLVRLSSIREPSAADNTKLYKLFYDHIVTPKPDSVEAWMKTVSIMDIKHLYATAYRASFEGVNFLPFDCTNPRCNNGFVSDSLPWEDMVKYENEDARKEAMRIYKSNPPESDYKLYTTEIVPISDVYAMSFKEPSIYDVQIAPLYLDPDWYTKMEGTISINAYVDSIYVIDAKNKALRPLFIKSYHGDTRKTLKAKVLALGKVLTTLTSDQYNLISSYIEEINKTMNYVNYQRPEVICPKCGKKIEAVDQNPAELLFTRHRLTSLANG